ncbi:tyrosine-type recombinase/integrase [Rhodococcus opacus]|nr:tyrosine-type recombinase/integrase [Rhodococcus opacus]ELB87118.1 phague integrase [Rhodococcus wratislaviensis IFP 2016]MDX5962790.1 tyrosine-type recombinase/integrase [Rhodococcus opacus]
MVGHGELSACFEQFLAYRSPGKPSPHTARAFRQDFDAIASALAAARGGKVDDLGAAEIDQERMCTAFGTYAETHAPASIRRCWFSWNALCDYLFAQGRILENPMPRVSRPKVETTAPKPFDHVAVKCLVANLHQPDEANARAWQERDLALVLTALLTGCRLSELVSLNVGDLRDLDSPGGSKEIRVHGKGKRQRILIAEPSLVEVLTSYLASRVERFPGALRTQSGGASSTWQRLSPDAPLFVGHDGERITDSTAQYRVKRAYQRAGIDGQRTKGALVQQLRNTFATSLADADTNVDTLMRLLGLESVTTTQHYARAAGKDARSKTTAIRIRHLATSVVN